MSENTSLNRKREKFTTRQIIRFVVPSVVGGFSFLCPIMYQGNLIIPITIIINSINDFLADYLVYIVFSVLVVAGIFTFIGTCFKPKFIVNSKILSDAFCTTWVWLVFRLLGVVIAIMCMFNVGPNAIISADTGGFMLSLVATITTTGVVAGAFLPFLTEFGLMEYIGTFVSRVFKKLFLVPGRAAVDCLTSWLGVSVVAVILTNQQYERGYYNAKEACIIATTFSACSITFALVVIQQVGIMDMFFPFYATVCAIGVICAIIMPRIPPLSRKKDEYLGEKLYDGEIFDIPGYNLPQWAFHQAVTRAINNGYTVKGYLRDWVSTLLTIQAGIMPIVMSIGTLSLILAYYTPVLEWLGLPFMPLLNLLQIPEAQAASTTLLAGFADMFIPAIIAGGTIESEFTRFLIAVVSITQVISITENGAMILSTKIPVNLGELFIIFLERTIISLIAGTLIIRFILQIPM